MSVRASIAIVVLVAAITYLMRASVILAVADRRLPPIVERSLQYVGPAVLTALAVNLAAGGEGGPHLDMAEALSMMVAGGVAWWRRNLILTLVAGMATLWLLEAVL